MFILHFRLFWAYYFFLENSHFLGEKGWDWDTPTPLIWILSQVYPKFDRLFLAHFLGGPINYWRSKNCPFSNPPILFFPFPDLHLASQDAAEVRMSSVINPIQLFLGVQSIRNQKNCFQANFRNPWGRPAGRKNYFHPWCSRNSEPQFPDQKPTKFLKFAKVSENWIKQISCVLGTKIIWREVSIFLQRVGKNDRWD